LRNGESSSQHGINREVQDITHTPVVFATSRQRKNVSLDEITQRVPYAGLKYPCRQSLLTDSDSSQQQYNGEIHMYMSVHNSSYDDHQRDNNPTRLLEWRFSAAQG